MRAYILIKARASQRWVNIKYIQPLHGVERVDVVLGRLDIIVTAQVDTIEELAQLVGRINDIDSIHDTETLLVAETGRLDTALGRLENALAQGAPAPGDANIAPREGTRNGAKVGPKAGAKAKKADTGTDP